MLKRAGGGNCTAPPSDYLQTVASIALYYVLIQEPHLAAVQSCMYHYYNTGRIVDADRKPWQHPVLKRVVFEGAPTGEGQKKREREVSKVR